MKYSFNDKEYDVVISYKNVKNMYMRIKSDLVIYITAPSFVNERKIRSFIDSNSSFINKNLLERERIISRDQSKFLYMGNSYDICYSNNRGVVLGNSKAFINRDYDIYKWYRKRALEVFNERFDVCFSLFNKKVCKPLLKIRRMTSKWGVCNVTDGIITLNLELIKFDVRYLDYVIYHELSHLIYPNHSSDFWNLVSCYVPDYKKIRKEMKSIV